ncbi:MAG: hypothetical protein A3E01_15385 [Gammaproteobacteria bacterium RIFCSPHIGHO2_12_FULL_63_22]|nr:MAG: hypothetical protein A3E01_15385 [Gammaproteobacteria bacterium RIFCSPHIGHO2_12_FULL_63_22]
MTQQSPIHHLINPIEDANEQRRIKLLPLSPNLAFQFLREQGDGVYYFEGWPEGFDFTKCKLKGCTLSPTGEYVMVLYHPSFPFLLEGVNPEMIVLHWKRQRLEPVAEGAMADA